MKPKPYGIIYLLIDATCDKEYVGQTTRSFKERFHQHKRSNQYIDRVIKQRGEDLIATAILKVCYSKEELDYWEKYFIKSRNTMAPNGYNLTEGGEGTVGCYPSEETLAKLSAAMSGENNPFFGKKHTADSIAKMSESHLGNTAWVGRRHRKESKVKMSTWRRADSPFKNLLSEIDKRQLTYGNLAELLGMPRPTLPEKMRNIKGFTAVEVFKLEKIFNLPAEYLMARDDGQIFSPCKNSPFKNLLMELDEHNITYRELAKLFGYGETNISQKMSGRKNFTTKDIAKLVEIFNKPIEYLLERDDGLPGMMTEAEKSAKRSKEHRGNSPFKNLLAEMDKRNLTYGDLAEIFDLERATVSDKMRGKLNFTAKDIAKLVEIFDKPTEYLLERDDGLSAIISEEEKSVKKSKAQRSNSPYKNLINELDVRQLSYKGLAKLMGLEPTSLSRKMRNEYNFTAKDIAKLVEIFDKPAEYLMKRDEN